MLLANNLTPNIYKKHISGLSDSLVSDVIRLAEGLINVTDGFIRDGSSTTASFPSPYTAPTLLYCTIVVCHSVFTKYSAPASH